MMRENTGTNQDKEFIYSLEAVSVTRFRKLNQNFLKSVVLTNWHEEGTFIQQISDRTKNHIKIV